VPGSPPRAAGYARLPQPDPKIGRGGRNWKFPLDMLSIGVRYRRPKAPCALSPGGISNRLIAGLSRIRGNRRRAVCLDERRRIVDSRRDPRTSGTSLDLRGTDRDDGTGSRQLAWTPRHRSPAERVTAARRKVESGASAQRTGTVPNLVGCPERKRMTYGSVRPIFPSLPRPRHSDAEAPSRRAPEVHSALGPAIDARRHTH
jgi:hypothetical protein